MHKTTKESAVNRFAGEARVFCAWATGDDGSICDARSALTRVLSIYQAGLQLPQPWTEGMNAELADAKVSDEHFALVAKRACELPRQVYVEIFDPYEQPAESVTCHLADDICDIYADVARGLMLFDRGQRDEALWEWGFNFRIHWGEHATGAIRALHAHLAQENWDGLTLNV